MGGGDEGAKTVAKTGLWEAILKEVASAQRVPDSTLLLFGRPGVGKRTLVQALMVHAHSADGAAEAASPEGHSRAVGLDFAYFGARDPEENELAASHGYVCPAACRVWMLEDPKNEPLLKGRLSAAGLRHYAAVICLDLREPWTMMEDLGQWLEVLQSLTSGLMQELALDQQDALRSRVVDCMKNYKEEPGQSGGVEDGSAASLVYNLGIPLVVVVTKADGVTEFEKHKCVGWSETIEAYLRSQCLNYGASILYTIAQGKNSRNIDVLYEYLMHRLYSESYPLKQKAIVPSRDALFVPTGWDSQAKVNEVASALPGGEGLNRPFDTVVVPLVDAAPPTAPVEECKDMETFLKQSSETLRKLGGSTATSTRRHVTVQDRPVEQGAGAATTGDKSSPPAAAAGGPPSAIRSSITSELAAGGAPRPRAGVPGLGAAGNGEAGADAQNSSLANFFQGLLNRGQNGPGGARASLMTAPPGAPGAGAALPPQAGAAPPPAT